VNELVFLWAADADIQTAFDFYENFQPGRGALFLHHLDAALGYLKTFPEIAPTFAGAYRRLLVPRFPYGVFYSVTGKRVIICGVLDLRQDPNAIRDRLGLPPE
jgi:plasmid stabilization system protein ParE